MAAAACFPMYVSSKIGDWQELCFISGGTPWSTVEARGANATKSIAVGRSWKTFCATVGGGAVIDCASLGFV